MIGGINMVKNKMKKSIASFIIICYNAYATICGGIDVFDEY